MEDEGDDMYIRMGMFANSLILRGHLGLRLSELLYCTLISYG